MLWQMYRGISNIHEKSKVDFCQCFEFGEFVKFKLPTQELGIKEESVDHLWPSVAFVVRCGENYSGQVGNHLFDKWKLAWCNLQKNLMASSIADGGAKKALSYWKTNFVYTYILCMRCRLFTYTNHYNLLSSRDTKNDKARSALSNVKNKSKAINMISSWTHLWEFCVHWYHDTFRRIDLSKISK